MGDLKFASDHLAPIESHIYELVDVLTELDKRCLSGIFGLVDLEECFCICNPGNTIRKLCLDVYRDGNASIGSFRKAILDALVQRWSESKYWDKNTYPRREVFGQRETSEAVGVDIGSSLKSAISDSGWSQDWCTTKDLLKSLQQWGFCVVKQAVSEDAIEHLRNELGITTNHAALIGQHVLQKDPNISHSRASANRLQLLLRGSTVEEVTSRVHQAVLPIVTAWYDRRFSVMPRIMLSDVRLVVVDHAAHATNWTIYNPKGGLSVMIPLRDRNSRNGSQVFIPGSHFLLDKNLGILTRIRMAASRYLKLARPVQISDLYDDGTWKSGDAFIFDNHLLIHGEENRLFKSGAYLLVKYETVEEAPPTLYLKGKILFRVGSLLEYVAKLTRT
jgi:ectoine hydroxylase-related dioxygenase (phytanoyl-CoA dioxygenase family)